jgi:hypothetical protein
VAAARLSVHRSRALLVSGGWVGGWVVVVAVKEKK